MANVEYPKKLFRKLSMSWAEIIMAAEGKRLSNNMAGIEFVACMETIKEFLQKSWKHSQIHRQLKQEGKITMSYGAFCYHMRRLSLDQHKPGETPPPVQAKKIAPAPVRPSAGPRHVTTSGSAFPNPRDMNPDEALLPKEPTTMATIHFIQQGKGGVGKSMIAVILYQVLGHLGKEIMAFDTDPVNSTLAGFREFAVTRLDILKNGDIDPREFDVPINEIAALPVDTHVIVDNGASSFLALNSYIKENDVLGILTESGHNVFFHTVITGGQAIGDTVLGLRSLALGFPESPIVVWLNPYFGEIRMDDRSFEEFKVYQEFSDQFHAVITIPQGNKATLGKDLEMLFAKRQSFATAINFSQSIVMRSRLSRYWNELVSVVEQAAIAF